jgi:hypothetical protein
MNNKIKNLLNNHGSNHIIPFLWIHGESEETYRRMVKAIDESNIKAFCIEARPHKEFCKDKWWKDLDVILDEAEKRKMKVWILDDKHFPTGYAGGALENGPLELKRQHICHKRIFVTGGKKIKLSLGRLIHPNNKYDTMSLIIFLYASNYRLKKYKDDSLLSCTAYNKKRKIDLSGYIKNMTLSWQAPEGEWTIEICSLSRNTGFHRSYINMMDMDSCRVLIDSVYEPHYAHYKEKFGKTIAGFFSDEPELGNGNYIKFNNYLGTEQSLPYSRELAVLLQEQLGGDWINLLPLLWNNDFDKQETAKVRYVYMDCVTRLVEKDFSKQIGQWCREHGVEYIGHVIEQGNQHARTSTSLGHYFRGLKWQTMAGIDVIGGELYPNGEDLTNKNWCGIIQDGEFFHYALGKLGSSLGAVNPNMQGRAMCELFGNYGWSMGVRFEKYLLDHFMVRGINYFVPHAFNSGKYPSFDCPPHFYAHGHDPQYRHFGSLMNYTNRISSLISGGQIQASIAVLYHGEAEWTGKCMLMQKPARILWDNQLDFNFVPCDIFKERDFYITSIGSILEVNKRQYKLLIIPYAQYITLETALGIKEYQTAGGRIVFIDELPEGICTGERMPEEIMNCEVVKLEALMDYVSGIGLQEIRIAPLNKYIRVMHYAEDMDLYYFFNEGNTSYNGTVLLPSEGKAYVYDAWNNCINKLVYTKKNAGTEVVISLEPGKSLIIIFDEADESQLVEPVKISGSKLAINTFQQSICKSIEYPNFIPVREINRLESYSLIDKKFSGFIRYETSVELKKYTNIILEITDAQEGVEVFVNRKSAGLQIVPIFLYDITLLCMEGKNDIVIEVATTLERENKKAKKDSYTGITGNVNLYFCE